MSVSKTPGSFIDNVKCLASPTQITVYNIMHFIFTNISLKFGVVDGVYKTVPYF